MPSVKLSTICTIAAVTLSAPAAWAQSPPEVSWGGASNSLQLGVSVLAANGSGKTTVFEVSLKNIGADDFVLNLGIMLRNGKVMFPDAVRLMLTGPSDFRCELHYFDGRYAIIAARMDDFTVALPHGATYTLRVSANRLWCPATIAPVQLPPGNYRVTARFEGRGAMTTNLDMKGAAFMNFWTGTAESGTFPFEVSQP